MVGVINPNSTFTLARQKELAANSTLQLTPDEPWPSETYSTPPPTSTPTGAGSSNQNQDNDKSSSEGSSGLGAGAIAGIAIGAAVVLLLAGALIYLCGRRGGFDSAHRKSQAPTVAPGIHPGMAEAGRYHDPKSPGQASMATFMGTERDPYRMSAQSPHGMAHYNGTPPPPVSPGMPGYGNYQSTVIPGQYQDHPHQHQQHGYQ